MNELVLFTVLGLGVGSLYALAAQGLVAVYRGSGVLNFAQSAFALVGAYVYYELHASQEWPVLPAFVLGTAAAVACGMGTYLLILRPLRRSSSLMQIVATLAVLITVEGLATIRYGDALVVVPGFLPQDAVTLWSDVTTSQDRLFLIAISVFVTAALFVTYTKTKFARATTAVAESERAAAAMGLSPDLVATANWAIGSALAAIAAILVIPITGLSVAAITNLTLVALAAALVGGFKSFPLTWVGAMVIGVVETHLGRVTSITGLAAAAPLLIIVLTLGVRGRALPLRDHFMQRQPSVGTGRIRPPLVLGASAVFVVLAFTAPATWTDAFTTTLATGIVILSVVVVTGYAGQISLAQWAIAGLGAFVAGRLVATQEWPFEAVLVAGVVATALIGVVFALPAVRIRGVNLAIVTLALGTAVEVVVFNNVDWTGGLDGTRLGDRSFFGIDVNAAAHSDRYSLLTFALFMIVALAVANLRRGRVGRRLLAVRANERAAAALGIHVPRIKLYAFAVAAGIAGLGGILYTFRDQTIVYENFTNSYSITLIGLAVIGGIGWVNGSLLGGQLAVGAVGEQLVVQLWPSAASYIVTFSGVVLILIIIAHPNGLAEQMSKLVAVPTRIRPKGKRAAGGASDGAAAAPPSPTESAGARPSGRRVPPTELELEDVSVSYGAVSAVHGVSFAVAPGQIVGLIGPNGAGKTSLIDAISGFVAPDAGRIALNGTPITGWSPSRRAAAGLSRSFQSLELFEDMTVLENLRAAFEPHDVASYLCDLAHPRQVPVPEEIALMIREFRLDRWLDHPVRDLPYGARRLLAVARAAATGAAVLLLDEPAAGLSDGETRELAEIVRKLASERGIGILLVEHDVDFVMAVCHHIVVINFGREIAAGPPAEVRQDDQVIAAYLGTAELEGSTEREPVS